MESSRGIEGASWQAMENACKRPVNTRNVRNLSLERVKAKKFVKDAEKEKQEGRGMPAEGFTGACCH